MLTTYYRNDNLLSIQEPFAALESTGGAARLKRMETEMSALSQLQHGSIYRIDKFTVPSAAREEFLKAVNKTKAHLDLQAGCLQNVVLELQSGSGRFNFLTIVEWDGPAAFENAKAAMAEVYRASGFNPQAFITRWGIEADMANYKAVEAS
jgi:antibiotic biosynthesis monooxygenase